MTRRSLLAAAAAWPGGAAADSALRAKARKNLKLSIFASVYAKLPAAEAARRIKADGFGEVILRPVFADVQFDPLAPDWPAADKIVAAFRGHGIRISGLHGYYNVVDPDVERRKRGEAAMRCLLTNWKRFGSPVVCTETGTFNRQSEWAESPENATEGAYRQCREALRDMVKLAEKTGAVVAVEPYWRNVIDSPERTARLFREIDSPAFKLVMDPCNYYRPSDLDRMQPMLEEIFRRVGHQTVLAHAKDVKASPGGTDLPAPGKGVLDYPLYLRLLARLDRELCLAVEHLTLDDVPRSRDYVLAQFDRI